MPIFRGSHKLLGKGLIARNHSDLFIAFSEIVSCLVISPIGLASRPYAMLFIAFGESLYHALWLV
jgi:hypothetical protein